MKFYRELCLKDFTARVDLILQIGHRFDTFWGQIPSYNASNWGFSVFLGFFKLVIISYLLVYTPNQKSELKNSVSLVIS
jgi:hypothetical protein